MYQKTNTKPNCVQLEHHSCRVVGLVNEKISINNIVKGTHCFTLFNILPCQKILLLVSIQSFLRVNYKLST